MTKMFIGPHQRRISCKMAGMALLVGVWLAGVVIAHAQSPSPDIPVITYRREFKGSVPEFIEIVLRQDGTAKIDVRQLSDAPSPQDIVVSAAYARQIFDLAGQMRNFQGADLDAQRRVAYMGDKTLRWDQGAETHEAKFNYTLDPKANQLQKMFDNLAQEQADLTMLEERLRFDRLGVDQGLNQFEEHLNKGQLPDPERFLAVLDKIAEDTRVIERARQRARSTAARIRVATAK